MNNVNNVNNDIDDVKSNNIHSNRTRMVQIYADAVRISTLDAGVVM
jgi:hypothetical protein